MHSNCLKKEFSHDFDVYTSPESGPPTLTFFKP